jgi:O-antigen/teichoic acid export membrane protein
MAITLNKAASDEAQATPANETRYESQHSDDVSNPLVAHYFSLTDLVRTLTDRFAGQRDLRAVLTGATQVMVIRMVGAALAYVTAIFMARWLGTFEFGIYAYVWVCALILSCALPLGYPSAALRFLPDYLARGKWRRLHGFLKESVLVSLGVSTLGAIAGAVLILVFKSSIESYYVVPLLVGLICIPATALLNQMETTARAFGWLQTAFVPGYILRPLLPMAMVYALVKLGFEPTAVEALWALVAACLLASLVQGVLVFRGVSAAVPAAKPVHHSRHWSVISLSFVTIDGFRQILENCDVLMIGRLLDPTSVAAYYAAIRTGGLIAFIYFAVVALAVPTFAKIHISGTPEDMQRFISGVIQLMFWPSALAALALACLGPYILSLFGMDFGEGYPPLIVALAGLLIRASTGPVEYMLNMTGHHRDTMLVYGIAAAACIVLNLVLIPIFGILGAALSAYGAIAGASIALSLLVRRRLGITAFIFPLRANPNLVSVNARA